MTDIKMSDVFELTMTVETGREIDSKELMDRNGSFYATFYNAQGCISAAKAINAYDENQERIKTLTHENALLENQLKNAQAEIAELKKKARGY